MFFELTDLLACPRCGPDHGLVLLVDEVQDRRVRNGRLGCPNCRTDYRVRDGVADLRLAPNAQSPMVAPYEDDELALKLLALSGLAGQRGLMVLGERLAHIAAAVADAAPELDVVTVSVAGSAAGIEPGVSRVWCDTGWSLVEHRAKCVAIAPGGDASRGVESAARLVAAGGRLLLFDASDADVEAAQAAGLGLLAAEQGTAVAERRVGSLPIVG